jgi:hypothetical protein
MYAAGSRIISAMTQINDDNSNFPYYLNTSFKQQLLSGTSMAAPQVAGVAALVFQMHPDWTPRQVVSYIRSKALSQMFATELDDDYTSPVSLHGGGKGILYVPMASQRVFSFFRSTV